MRQNIQLITIESIDDKIIKKIEKAQRGFGLFNRCFSTLWYRLVVGKSLERLVEVGKVSRLPLGVYARLKQNPMFGGLLLAAGNIAKAIAKKDKTRIILTKLSGSIFLLKMRKRGKKCIIIRSFLYICIEN